MLFLLYSSCLLSLIWIKSTQVKCFVDCLTWTRNCENWWGRWKRWLWKDGERWSDAAWVFPAKEDKSCLLNTPGAGERARSPAAWVAGEVCKCEDSQRMSTRGTHWSGHRAWPSSHPVKTVSFQVHHRTLTSFDESSTANAKAVLVLVASSSDAGALWDQADTPTVCCCEQQQPCFGQVYSSAAVFVQWSGYGSPAGKITASEESYDPNKQTLILLLFSY